MRPHAIADDLVGVFAPGVAVVAQRVDRDQPFDEQVGEFHKEAKLGGIEDEPGEFFAHAILHEADLFPFHEFAFGFGGAALGLARLLGDLREFGFWDRRLVAPVYRRGCACFACGIRSGSQGEPSFGGVHGEFRRPSAISPRPSTPARSSALVMRCTMRSG